MGYSMDLLDNDCYENSSVLINKFDIRDEIALNELEQSITSALIAKAMVEIPFTNVNFDFYKNLHKYVFGDIYEWAGNARTVNMSKKGTRFCPFDKIEENGTRIFGKLINSENLKILSKNDFVKAFTEIYCEINYLHAFREGNGRIQRLFLTMLLNHIGYTLEWSEVDSDLLMIATVKAVSGDVFMLEEILAESINLETK